MIPLGYLAGLDPRGAALVPADLNRPGVPRLRATSAPAAAHPPRGHVGATATLKTERIALVRRRPS